MPRFSSQESTVLLEVVETFAGTTQDAKIRACLNSISRKVRQCRDHHVRRATEQRRAGHVVQKP